MADKIHTFIIEIPKDVEFTPEEITTLEGQFQVDAGHILDARVPESEPTEFTNVGSVRVVTKIQAEEQPAGGGGELTAKSDDTPTSDYTSEPGPKGGEGES
jgi:hypothetical protein